MNLLLATLRPLADVLDLAAEAAVAVGTLSVAAVGLVLVHSDDRAALPAADAPRPRT